MKFPAVLLFFLLLTGCASLESTKHTSRYSTLRIGDKDIFISGEISSEKLTLVEKMLNFLNPSVLKSVNYINFHKEGARHFQNEQAAHCNRDTICLGELHGGSLVWHEAAHAYIHSLGDGFLKEWKEIAGDIYIGNEYEKFNNAFTKGIILGVVSAYGLMDAREDIAEWTEEVYKFVYPGMMSVFVNKDKIDRTDPRFKKKLELLYQKGFFNKDFYEKIKPLLE